MPTPKLFHLLFLQLPLLLRKDWGAGDTVHLTLARPLGGGVRGRELGGSSARFCSWTPAPSTAECPVIKAKGDKGGDMCPSTAECPIMKAEGDKGEDVCLGWG